MEITRKEFDMINELESAFSAVEKLSEILLDYEGEKEFLINLLCEKMLILKNKLDEFTSLMLKI